MERFNALGRGAQLMLAAGVLFLISTFFNWQEVDIGPVEAGQSAWHGFWGVVMGLLAIVLVAWLIARVAGIDIPLPVSAVLISAVLAVLIFVFALIKVLTDDFVSTWAWIGLVLAALIVVGAWLEVQAAGGVDALRSEATTLGSGFGSSRDTSATTVPPATTASGEPTATPRADEPVAPPAPSPPPVTHPEPPADADEPPRSTT